MPELFPQTFTVESSLALPVDSFEATYPGGAVYLGRSADTTVTLQSGFYDDVGIRTVAAHIVSGIVEEWEFARETYGGRNGPSEMVVTRVRGFDAGKRLGDFWIRKRYVRPTTPAPITTVTPEAGAIPEVRGEFTYAQVAAEACAAAGLGLAWQLPSPVLQRDFTANGRVLDVLATLASPWSHAEPTRADIYLAGGTVIVRQRTPAPSGGTVLTVAQLRPFSVRFVARRSKPIGVIVVRGLEFPVNSGGSTVIINPNDPFTVDVSTETTQAHYEYLYGKPPSGLLVSGVKRTFQNTPSGAVLTSKEVTTNDWEPLLFDGGKPVSTPKQLRGYHEIEGIDPKDKAFRLLQTEQKTFSYDFEGYLTEERTLVRKWIWDKDPDGVVRGTFRDFELHIRTIVGEGPLLVADTNETYKPTDDGSGQFDFNGSTWDLASHSSGTVGGHRPGGPARRVRQNRRDRKPGTEPVVVASNGTAGARTIEISCPDLEQGQCQQIHNQLRAWAGTSEHEVRISAPTVPWIRRGDVLQLTGVVADDGTPIPEAPMTVYEMKINHDESTETPRSTMTLRLVRWT